MLWAEILIVLLLILVNGFFSMAELAVLSARKSRLQRQTDKGAHDARTALDFIENSGPFLATTQIGITLVGILTGVFSGATLADQLAALLQTLAVPATLSQGLAMGIVVLGITALTLVFGELVPKQMALRQPEKIARRVARPIQALTRLAAPLVHLFNLVTQAVLRGLGQDSQAKTRLEREDLLQLLQEGKDGGSVSAEAHQLMERTLELEGVQIGGLMTPRRHMICIDLLASAVTQRQTVLDHLYTCYPVCEGNAEQIRGVVYLKDLLPVWAQTGRVEQADLTELIREPFYLPDTLSAARALQKFREHGHHEALIFDRHSQVQGILRLSDLLLALSIPATSPVLQEIGNSAAVQMPGDFSLPLFGACFARKAALTELPEHIHTLSGLILHLAGDIPQIADTFIWENLMLHVTLMDGPRICRVEVRPLPGSGYPQASENLSQESGLP